jgi:hypothetical protein
MLNRGPASPPPGYRNHLHERLSYADPPTLSRDNIGLTSVPPPCSSSMPWLSARGDHADRLPGGVRKLKDFDIDGSMRYLFRASPRPRRALDRAPQARGRGSARSAARRQPDQRVLQGSVRGACLTGWPVVRYTIELSTFRLTATVPRGVVASARKSRGRVRRRSGLGFLGLLWYPAAGGLRFGDDGGGLPVMPALPWDESPFNSLALGS